MFETNSEIVGSDPGSGLIGANSREYRADLEIGADGVNYKVRESLGIATERKTFTHGVIRVLVQRDSHDLSENDPDNVIHVWATRLKILCVPCNADVLHLAMMVHKDDAEAAVFRVNNRA